MSIGAWIDDNFLKSKEDCLAHFAEPASIDHFEIDQFYSESRSEKDNGWAVFVHVIREPRTLMVRTGDCAAKFPISSEDIENFVLKLFQEMKSFGLSVVHRPMPEMHVCQKCNAKYASNSAWRGSKELCYMCNRIKEKDGN